MALGFQPAAFQPGAFQLDIAPPRTAFQSGAFQFGAFQVESVQTAAVGGLDYSTPRKKRYVVRKDGQLLVFSTRQDAELALYEPEPVKVEEKPVKAKAKGKSKPKAVETPKTPPDKPRYVEPPAPPLQVLDIAYVLAMARIRGLAKAAQEMLARQRYEALLDLAWQMQDEEDVEMLLMAVH